MEPECTMRQAHCTVCTCLHLGSHLEARSETGVWVQVVYLRDDPRKQSEEADQ